MTLEYNGMRMRARWMLGLEGQRHCEGRLPEAIQRQVTDASLDRRGGRSRPAMTVQRTSVVWALALALGLQPASAFADDDAARGAGIRARPPAITVIEAKRITFVDNVLVTGSLVPREEVMAGPEIDGYRITALLAEEGDRVEAGQALARLSREILEAQLAQNAASVAKSQAVIEQVRNQIAEMEATLHQSEDSFNRVKPLRELGVASQATYDERDASFRQARARLAAQKEGLKLAEADLILMRAQRQELEVKLGRTEDPLPRRRNCQPPHGTAGRYFLFLGRCLVPDYQGR